MGKKGICETCKDTTCMNYSTRVTECLDYERMTNADRIRAMTDEELANFIGGIFTMERDVCGCYDPHTVVTQEPRVEIRDFSDMIEWLKEEVTE